jgi:hypothetical protein
MLPRHLVDKDQRGILGKEPDRLVRQERQLVEAQDGRKQLLLAVRLVNI